MFEGMINWVDDRVNPILVKELRQSTNSRILTVLVMAFLAIQLFSMYMQIFLSDSTSFDRRQVIFPTVLAILVGACVYGIIPSISNRFFKERSGDSIDLIYTTVLSPFAVIAGKMFSAMGLIILLYSLCVPFIFISYLFPGIDILTIFWSLWYSFWIITAIAQLMILVATINTSQLMRGIILLIYFGAITIFSFSAGASFITEVFGHSSISHVPLKAHLFFMLFWLLLIGFMYVLAVCAVSAPHANRALWPRIYAVGFWLVGLIFVIGSYLWLGRSSAMSVSETWLVLSSIVFLAFTVVASGERTEYGKRLRRRIPRNKFLRILVFPFFSGEINGFIYSLIFLSLTVLIFYLLPHKTGGRHEELRTTIGLVGYFVWYCLLALQLKRMLINRFPNINSFLIMLFSVIIFTLGPMLLAWGIYHDMDLRSEEIAPFLVLSFGFMLFQGYEAVGILISWGLSLITLLILMSFFKRRISEFKPLEIQGSEEEFKE